MNIFLKVLVVLTFLELAISEPIGENCQMPKKVENMKHVLVECIGTKCQWVRPTLKIRLQIFLLSLAI